jgi:hypothetical protein
MAQIRYGVSVLEISDSDPNFPWSPEVIALRNQIEAERLKAELTGLRQQQQQQQEQRAISSGKVVMIDNSMWQDAELPGKMNWNDACKYCENLRLLGFSDWRLPNIGELKIAYQHKSKFRNMQNDSYWSISKYNDSYSWSLNFYYGGDGYYYFQGINYLLCCVR